MQVNSGLYLSYVKVWAFGSYTLTGVGSSVDADVSIAVKEILAPHRVWTDPLTSAPAFPLVSTVDHMAGAWYGISRARLDGGRTRPAAPRGSDHLVEGDGLRQRRRRDQHAVSGGEGPSSSSLNLPPWRSSPLPGWYSFAVDSRRAVYASTQCPWPIGGPSNFRGDDGGGL